MLTLGGPEGPITRSTPRSFEELAGPLDRLALALQLYEGTSIETTHPQVLRDYTRVVGCALQAVRMAELGVETDRRELLDEFARALWRFARDHRQRHHSQVSVFTVNYDTLLDQALVRTKPDAHTSFYDGFYNKDGVSYVHPVGE